jgi:hypothetical protein
MEAEVKCRTFLNLLARKIQIFISAFRLFKPNLVGPRTGQSGEERISIPPANRTLIVQAVAFRFINWIIQHPVIRFFKIYLRNFSYYIIVKFKSAETN